MKKVSAYDTIGTKYNAYRNADTRITAALKDLLGLQKGSSIVDVGAGTGNYTNALASLGYKMKAVEPSPVMREQSIPHPHVEWVTGSAESIPLADGSVDGLVSTLAIHHFPDIDAASLEMWRVCGNGPMVLFTIDPRRGASFWFKDYFPGIYNRIFDVFPPVEELISIFTGDHGATASIHDFPLPFDLADLNMHAGWNKPEIYFDPEVRRGMSGFAVSDESEIKEGLNLLKRELENGDWEKHNGHLRKKSCYDLGFVFVKLQTGI
ncbi:class I SAM-dependent methyltransferase [Desulfosudis oleivorans]|uniref:Methyltransferase type 11 n=1 Tax=Desulfosudis oleivorans (strain DSM 6200 / JCM 39069 / Hxd3) TaxID=96561 RepID=A8ZTK1_DESOH|nr:class I SAM-dependent methyltransferase [Desulfosudis oleivorans]ABW66265.1 Methyltransferase type 11 [Desulfosudis oleivorans Hxd3]